MKSNRRKTPIASIAAKAARALLAPVLAVSLFPMAAFAEDTGGVDDAAAGEGAAVADAGAVANAEAAYVAQLAEGIEAGTIDESDIPSKAYEEGTLGSAQYQSLGLSQEEAETDGLEDSGVETANSFRFDNGEPTFGPTDDPIDVADAEGFSTLASGTYTYYGTYDKGYCSGVGASRGIDVSSYQGSINWSAVKAAGVEFAILRCATGKTAVDTTFVNNFRNAKAAGLRVGVYYYSYSTSTSDSYNDAVRTINALNAAGATPASLDLPIYYDLEDDCMLNKYGNDTAAYANMTRTFHDKLRAAGYTMLGTYSSTSWYDARLYDSYFDTQYRWVARYNMSYGLDNWRFRNFATNDDIWQFTSTGRVSGISGDVDLNYTYSNMIAANVQDSPGAMHRMYNPNSGEHFYTGAAYEANVLIRAGWRYEGIAWTAPTKSNTPVYRLYNPNAGDHHYTTSSGECNYLVSVGWRYEGVGWYSADNKATSLHRLYNPNAISGTHHYTVNTAEVNMLVGLGWRYEGIGWHGL